MWGPAGFPPASLGSATAQPAWALVKQGSIQKGGASSLSFIKASNHKHLEIHGTKSVGCLGVKLQLSWARQSLNKLVRHWPLPSILLCKTVPLPPSFPPFQGTQHTHFIWVVELPALSPGLSDTRTTILYGGLWGRRESWGREGAGFHLPFGHHPIMFHRNLKLQISESELSPNSFHVLTSGDGTAVCLGALPTPGHLLPTAWPLLPILATSAQNTSPLA